MPLPFDESFVGGNPSDSSVNNAQALAEEIAERARNIDFQNNMLVAIT